MTTRLRRLTVLGHDVRVSVRAGRMEERPEHRSDEGARRAGLDGPANESSSSRRPLLLCNGIGASLDLLEPFVDSLDPDIEVVSFDVPGVGGSATPTFPYTFGLLAHFVGKLMDQLGYAEFDVLGISWGGGLAQQLAFQNPRRVKHLVLVSTGTGMLMIPAHPRVLAKMVTPRRYRDPEYAKAIAAELYGGRMRDEPGVAERLLHNHSRLGSVRGYVYQLLAGVGWTSLPFLPFFRQKTLILAGSDDPIIPVVNARIMHALIPNSSLHIYDDGHLGLITKCEELGPLVSEFVR